MVVRMRGITKPFVHLVLALTALMLTATPVTAQTWHRADTRNFVIYYDGSARTLEQFARRVEMFDAQFRVFQAG